MNNLLWTPSEQLKENSNLRAYMQWLAEKQQLQFDRYDDLWSWSVNRYEDFWTTLLTYFNIRYNGKAGPVVQGNSMPHIRWFEGLTLNYAEHVFRNATASQPAIISLNEAGTTREVSWQELQQSVSGLQHFFKKCGIGPGDRIAAYLPCIPEATIAFLATSSLGAVWSSCSPDFGTQAVLDRFAQIEPVVLFAVTTYRYNGKLYDKSEVVRAVANAIPSLKYIVLLDGEKPVSDTRYVLWTDAVLPGTSELQFERLPFSHPLWVLYSSGTTGLPKAMVHSHGGILLEHLKYLTFHNDIHPGDRCFWFTTTGWMMWNYIQSSLLCGGVLVIYDGSPAWPGPDRLWQLAEEHQITHLGTSASFIMSCARTGLRPGDQYALGKLRSIGSTGSTLPPEGFEWVYRAVKNNVWLASISGGTDVCSAFVGGNPLLPVYAGEIQCRALGCRVEAFDESGRSVTARVGEMVITTPMPSMPVYFWNDPGFKRYTESYFEMFPGVWRHGDWIEITPRGGVIIYGRSDATLNRAGVRIGTSEIYRAVDKVAEVADSLIVCLEKPDGSFWMPLFVKMKEGITLDEALKQKINQTIRNETSPRHVPDNILPVADIPYTISGKKTETPVKKILMGKNPDEVINPGALRNPESLQCFMPFVLKNQ
ncbi:MAG: acetoacetyl-CoA synthetase [Cyclobacteriaceae bacterium]|nr:MAG: acetoacetyl-CoA synthetase [Cyclobacteriaceae bacterium]